MLKRLPISVFFFAIMNHVLAQPAAEHYVHIPDTISPEAQAYLRILPDPHLQPTAPDPTEIEQWTAIQNIMEARNLERQKDLVGRLGPDVTKQDIGGVPVLEIKPRNWRDNGKVLVYTHGSAYTLQSAASTLGSSALMADATGLRIISIDYTLAPHAKWQEVTDQVVAVFSELGDQGYAMKRQPDCSNWASTLWRYQVSQGTGTCRCFAGIRICEPRTSLRSCYDVHKPCAQIYVLAKDTTSDNLASHYRTSDFA